MVENVKKCHRNTSGVRNIVIPRYKAVSVNAVSLQRGQPVYPPVLAIIHYNVVSVKI